MRLPAPYSIVCGFDIGEHGGFTINKRTGQSDLFVRGYDIGEFIEWCRVFGVERIYAENVHTFPGQGVVSMGSLMERKGELRGIARTLEIPITWLQPIKWIECFTLKRSKHFKNKPQWKKHLLEVAQGLAPDSLVNEISIETCDSFLMWIYGAHISSGTPMKVKGLFHEPVRS